MSHVKFHLSPVTCHRSSLACHLLLVTCHVSLRQQPQPQNLHLLTPPQYIVGWFAKPHKPENKSKHIKKSLCGKMAKLYRYANISVTFFKQKSLVQSAKSTITRNGTGGHYNY